MDVKINIDDVEWIDGYSAQGQTLEAACGLCYRLWHLDNSLLRLMTMSAPRTDGIYYFPFENMYFCYQFRETGVITFAVEELTPEKIRTAARTPTRGSYVHTNGNRYKLGFSRDTDIYAKVQDDGSLDVVITTEYGEGLNERRIYQFMTLE